MPRYGFEVGQTVFVAFNFRNVQAESKVTAIGRKWVYLSNNERFDKTLRLDGGKFSSPGRVYRSEAEYRKELEVSRAWSRLKVAVNSRNIFDGLDVSDIMKAMDILGLEYGPL